MLGFGAGLICLSRLDFIFDVDSMGVVGWIAGFVTFCCVSLARYCSSMVGGMVVAIVDRDSLTIARGAVVCRSARVSSCCRPLLLARLAVPRTNRYYC